MHSARAQHDGPSIDADRSDDFMMSHAVDALELIAHPRVLVGHRGQTFAVRWRISVADGQPTAIAGLWRVWAEPDGGTSLSFTMLTVNAATHPLMSRFHKPGDEKRSVVIIRPDDYEDWLSCRNTDEARSFLQLYPVDEMHAEAFPLPPRAPRAKPTDDVQQPLLD